MDGDDQRRQIWKDDLLGRRTEAELLIAFLTRVAGHHTRDWARAYTLAVDAGYGTGKTFFLRRLAEHLSLSYPVALVDAWADDLQDDPLTALAATLYSAFAPLISTNDNVREKAEAFLSKTGKIAKIVGVGLLKRGAGFLITHSATEAIEASLQAVDVEIGTFDDVIKQDPASIVEGDAAVDARSAQRMRNRIADFEQTKCAVIDLKHALTQLVQAVAANGMSTPIFIIIDEIDRCRPTYSIKLFEQIKHLFDVEGLVFVFGMHQEALSHSVAGLYGPEFDGWHYLRRFINKTYNLREPDLTPLIAALLAQHDVNESRFIFPPVSSGNSDPAHVPVPVVISAFMKAYGLRARDAHYVVETLQTCLLLTGQHRLLLGYLLPLLLSSMRRDYRGQVVEPEPWDIPWSLYVGRTELITPADYVRKVRSYASQTDDDLIARVNSQPSDPVANQVLRLVMNRAFENDPLAHPRRYAELLEHVARFE